MGTPHKHADLIKAWADGAQIQEKSIYQDKWVDIGKNGAAIFWSSNSDYRIKPEPKPDVERWLNAYHSGGGAAYYSREEAIDNASPSVKGLIKVVFDGETGKLKSVEVVE